MAVSEDFPERLAAWCREHVPVAEREHRRLGWAINGDDVQISAREAPAFPELSAAWTTTPLARLRQHDPQPGQWSLYRPTGEDGWERFGEPAGDPFELLDRVTDKRAT